MDNPPITSSSPLPSHPSTGRVFLKALGFGLLLAIPMTILFMFGAASIISYFRMSYDWGWGGFIIPVVIAFYAFCGNAIIMVLATFITLERSNRPYFHAIFIGLIINLVAITGGWGYNLFSHQGELDQLKVQRNNDSYVTAKGLADCAKLTDVNYWTACIKDKILTTADLATCQAQALKYGNENSVASSTCNSRYIITTGSIAKCNDLPLVGSDPISQRYCIYDTLQKSWETNNRKTPLSIVEGCAAITDTTENQFCYVASLRQLAVGDEAAAIACQGINPDLLSGSSAPIPADIANIKNICDIAIIAS